MNENDSSKPVKWHKLSVIPSRVRAVKRERQMKFLAALAETGVREDALKISKINATTEQQWKNGSDRWYSDRLKEVIQSFRDKVESNVRDWAMEGAEVPIVLRRREADGSSYEEIVYVKKRDPLMTMFFAKRVVPEYREKYQPPQMDAQMQETSSPLTRLTVKLEMIAERYQKPDFTAIEVVPEQHQLTDGDDGS